MEGIELIKSEFRLSCQHKVSLKEEVSHRVYKTLSFVFHPSKFPFVYFEIGQTVIVSVVDNY